MAQRSIPAALKPQCPNSASSHTAYSSEVRSGRVAMRQRPRHSRPSCTAKTMLVFPASTASSMVSARLRPFRPPLQHLARGDAEGGASPRLEQQAAVLAEAREAPLGRAAPAPRGDALSAGRAVRGPGLADRCEALRIADAPPREHAVQQAGGETFRRFGAAEAGGGAVRHDRRVREIYAEAEHQPSQPPV